MTSRSLADVLDETLSPIWKAQTAVREDSVEKLRPLLEDPQNPITEHTWINSQTKENLLHFAVHQLAADCIALLVNRPFCWNSDLPNLLGRSPLSLAESLSYLPVWYPLACQSRADRLQTDRKSYTNVSSILTHPLDYNQHSYRLIEHGYSDTWPGPLVAIRDKFGNCDKSLSAINLALLLELLLATPQIRISNIPLLERMGKVSLLDSSSNDHPQNCSQYPQCLLGDYQPNSPLEPMELMLEIWKFHRQRYSMNNEGNEAMGMVDALGGEQSGRPEPLCPKGPLSLQSWCRIWFRRHALSVLGSHQSTIDNQGKPKWNYASLVSSLPAPHFIRAYLAYRELWPVLDRHLVAQQPRRTRSRFMSPVPLMRGLIDPIFPQDL